ncbi:MAG TPA: hypothetical protein VGH83_06460 [Candidatus Acidoferrum sp.]|jgi:hypothetical protein
MLIQSGDLWHCTNPKCLSELSIGVTREIEVTHVYCVCGSVMKKHYTPPVFTYLDFIGERKEEFAHGQKLPAESSLQHARNE